MQLYKLTFYIVSACTVVYGYKESSYSRTFRPEAGFFAGYLKHLHKLSGLNYTIDERAAKAQASKSEGYQFGKHTCC